MPQYANNLMSDALNYQIGKKIDNVDIQGFKVGFINPFPFKVTVSSHDNAPFQTHIAIFKLKNPDDARGFLQNIDKDRNLRAMLVGEERVVAKAIELLDKSNKEASTIFNPEEKKKDRLLAERIVAKREYMNHSGVRDASLAMGAKVPSKQEGILVQVPNTTIPNYKKKLDNAAGL